MTVADYIATRLKDMGAEYAFGIPSSEVATMLESLRRVGTCCLHGRRLLSTDWPESRCVNDFGAGGPMLSG